MGCVGSKKEQDPLSKGSGNDELQNRAQTAHYVKDPTAGNSGSKAVSSYIVKFLNECVCVCVCVCTYF